MAKYTLTKNYSEIKETRGVLQNLSGDSNIEVTNDTEEQGILLKPFQKLNFNQQLYARKAAGAGTALLAVIPFKARSNISESDDADDDDVTFSYEDLTASRNYGRQNKQRRHEKLPNPYDDFNDDFFRDTDWRKKPAPPPEWWRPPHPEWLRPWQPPPPPEITCVHEKMPSVFDDGNSYVLRIPKETLNGQKKFLVQFSDEMKG